MFIQNVIQEILPDVWPMLIIITVILSTIRVAYLLNHKKEFSLYREILALVFVIYILCLFHVVTFQDVNYGTSNFVPFREIFRYEVGSAKFLRNVMGNILLFIPYGFFVSYYLKNNKLSVITLLTLVAATTIEIVQLNIGRTFDIDDIILNVVGGILGFFIYFTLEAVRCKLPKALKKDWFMNLVTIVILLAIIIYSFNLDFLSWFNYIIGWRLY